MVSRWLTLYFVKMEINFQTQLWNKMQNMLVIVNVQFVILFERFYSEFVVLYNHYVFWSWFIRHLISAIKSLIYFTTMYHHYRFGRCTYTNQQWPHPRGDAIGREVQPCQQWINNVCQLLHLTSERDSCSQGHVQSGSPEHQPDRAGCHQ